MLFHLFRKKDNFRKNLFRSSIFGLEDSLVSSVGFLSGYVATGVASAAIVRSGLILIMVEAFSMGVGTFLSENNSEEITAHGNVKIGPSVQSGLVMWLSYLIGGMTVLMPYFFFTPQIGSILSISLSLFGLSGIGFITAHYAHTSYLKELWKAVAIGGLATLIGVAVGSLEV